MASVRLPSKPTSNSYSHLYGEDNGAVRRIPKASIADDKLDKNNPTGTGSFSLNRKAGSTVGDKSVSFGENTVASAPRAIADGYETSASGRDAHASGRNTIAKRAMQTAVGGFNVADPSDGDGSVKGKFIEIVGNGTSKTDRSNARAVDWDGNEYLKGDVYIDCEADSAKGRSVRSLASVRSFANSTVYNIVNAYGTYPRLMKYDDHKIYVFLDDRYRVITDGVMSASGYYYTRSATESDTSRNISITELANAFGILSPNNDGRIIVFFRAHGTANGVPYYSIRAKVSETDGTFTNARSSILWDTYTTLDSSDVSFWEPWAETGVPYVFFSAIRYNDPLNIEAGTHQDIVRLEFNVSGANIAASGNPITIINGMNEINIDGQPNVNARVGMATFARIKGDSYGRYIGLAESSVNLNAEKPRPLCLRYFYCSNLEDEEMELTDLTTILLPPAGERRGAPTITTLDDGRLVISFMSSDEYIGIHRTNAETYDRVMQFYISKIPVSYGLTLTDDLFVRLSVFDFSKNQWGRWGSVNNIDGSLYTAFTFGVNTGATTASRYGNVIIKANGKAGS